MTLPEQSDRAVAQTREFLVRLASPYGEDGIKGIRREVRAEALALLRHYPYAWQVSQKCDCPVEDNATNHDAAPAARAQPDPAGRDSDHVAGTGDTLTDCAVAEIARLNLAIRRLADQDATLSVQDGNVTVTMDATLTDEEREAGGLIVMHLDYAGRDHLAATLRGLLERLGGER